MQSIRAYNCKLSPVTVRPIMRFAHSDQKHLNECESESEPFISSGYDCVKDFLQIFEEKSTSCRLIWQPNFNS